MTTEWESVPEFSSPGEFARFARFVEKQVADGRLVEIPADPYGLSRYPDGERWFRDPGSGDVWRLAPPDFPFKGIWDRVQLHG